MRAFLAISLAAVLAACAPVPGGVDHLATDRSAERTTRPCPMNGALGGSACEYDIDELAAAPPPVGTGVLATGVLVRAGGGLSLRGTRAEVPVTPPVGFAESRIDALVDRPGRVVGLVADCNGEPCIEARSIGSVARR